MNQPKIKRDPEGTRRRILLAAAEEFAAGGLFGARVDQIARRAETNERMLYYYFGSKEQLFTAVLEHALSALVDAERTLDLDGIAPIDAMTRLAHFVWDYYRDHPELLRLINNENLHEAKYIKGSNRIRELISPIVETLKSILELYHRAPAAARENAVVAGLFHGEMTLVLRWDARCTDRAPHASGRCRKCRPVRLRW